MPFDCCPGSCAVSAPIGATRFDLSESTWIPRRRIRIHAPLLDG
ncbi:hypothetical protein C7S16_1939 [Burkholderia thailandensis]|uniref:Uncharacterized protein n=1 Tax=Burkholderia thailandensis TaxID=57975 RepID=A0AAW9D603_BURTH|nr:hypothetical protein [Burkholderia thailandensis]MDW9257363.1 hypothetical protein [Burkholderia thailandensis]